jgi:hypothetical protein
MEVDDDGYFHYDPACPPMFIQNSQPEDQATIQQAVIQYLRSSAQQGIRHHNAIMSSGLTPGEAAMLHFRDMKDKPCDVSAISLPELLQVSMRKHLGIEPNEFQECFQAHLDIAELNDQNLEQKLTTGLKAFLKEINKKSKGYTYALKHIVQDVREAREKNRFTFS